MKRKEHLPVVDLDTLRAEVVGNCFRYETPFGERRMVYTDYTASGRNVRFIERYLMKIQESYANTHTEDDETGRSTTEMLHRAERIIKREVGGNEDTCIIAVGTGATGAIQKLHEIVGISVSPATKEWVKEEAERFDGEGGSEAARCFLDHLGMRAPVVFIGPYEHHSNDISWRESPAETVMIQLGRDGTIDMDDLEKKLSDPKYDDRYKIGSFSAASNVSGVRTDVYEVARLLHRHGAIACFDFAASAPYVEIDMNRDDEACFDAIFISPHKFLGGPGSSGLLLFNRKIYRTDLPPTFASGGTVDYVSEFGYDFSDAIEAREKPGTPGTLQVMKAALAMELKRAIGVEKIEKRETDYLKDVVKRFTGHPTIEILGNPAPGTHIAIVSFNIRHDGVYLHPKLVTRLFNDLFGIQSRAGCSCAGPYGHLLLDIGEDLSQQYRCQINAGFHGIKPGWVRIGFHYILDRIDFEFICRAMEFLGEYGHLFLPLYSFDTTTGTWTGIDEKTKEPPRFGLTEALRQDTTEPVVLADEKREAECERYLAEAKTLARTLEKKGPPEYKKLPDTIDELSFFRVCHFR